MQKKDSGGGAFFIVVLTVAVVIILMICLWTKVPEVDTTNSAMEEATKAAHDAAVKSNWATVGKCLFVATVGFTLTYIVLKVSAIADSCVSVEKEPDEVEFGQGKKEQ